MTDPQERKVIVRLWGEETRRFYSEIVVAVPESIADDRIDSMALRKFDGVQHLNWTACGTTGIWPSNCGNRLKPEVQGAADESALVDVKLVLAPNGSVVIACCDPHKRAAPTTKRARSKS